MMQILPARTAPFPSHTKASTWAALTKLEVVAMKSQPPTGLGLPNHPPMPCSSTRLAIQLLPLRVVAQFASKAYTALRPREVRFR